MHLPWIESHSVELYKKKTSVFRKLRWCSSPSITLPPTVMKKNYSASVILTSPCWAQHAHLVKVKPNVSVLTFRDLSMINYWLGPIWFKCYFQNTASGLVRKVPVCGEEQWSTMSTLHLFAAIYSKLLTPLHGTATL